MGKKKERANPSQGKKQKIRRGYRGAQSRVSVYFLVWTIFATFTLLIVLMFGFTQRFIMTQSYKNEASKEVSVKGEQIADDIEKGIPPIFNGNVSAFLRILSQQHGVQVYLFSQEGNLLFPTEPSLEDFEDGEVYEEVKREAALLVKKMQQAKGESVLYEGDGAYVYGKEVHLYSESTMYLYVGQSLSLIETVSAELTVRTILIAIFTFILGFAIASAVAGWLTKPLSEMTEKAHRLAQGDFSVDFRGNEYGLELIELADTLNFARDELSKTDRMQKELIANVSHDFKTPLTMIKAYASMIMEISGSNPVKRNKHAQVIVDEADRLSSLVSDVLDLSKIRAGLSEFNTKTIDMSMKVEEILDRFPSDYLGDQPEDSEIIYCAEYFANQNGVMTVLPPRGLLTTDNGEIVVTLLSPTSAYPAGTKDNYGSYEHIYCVFTIEPESMTVSSIVLCIDK